MLAALGARLREQLGDRRRAGPARRRRDRAAAAVRRAPGPGRAVVRDLLAAWPSRSGSAAVESTSSCPPASPPARCTPPRAATCSAAPATRCAGPRRPSPRSRCTTRPGHRPRLRPAAAARADRRARARPDRRLVPAQGGAWPAAPRSSSRRSCAGMHPEHGVLDSATLRPLAARAGLTRRLTRVLLAEAVRRCAWWQPARLQLGVAVDLTTADVLDSRLPVRARPADQRGRRAAGVRSSWSWPRTCCWSTRAGPAGRSTSSAPSASGWRWTTTAGPRRR